MTFAVALRAASTLLVLCFCLSTMHLCVCVCVCEPPVGADGAAVPRQRSALPGGAALPIRDFTARQPVEGCDLQGSVLHAALRLRSSQQFAQLSSLSLMLQRSGDLLHFN